MTQLTLNGTCQMYNIRFMDLDQQSVTFVAFGPSHNTLCLKFLTNQLKNLTFMDIFYQKNCWLLDDRLASYPPFCQPAAQVRS